MPNCRTQRKGRVPLNMGLTMQHLNTSATACSASFTFFVILSSASSSSATASMTREKTSSLS
eukprot:scaffold24005_cov29-Tisochrysis_lutea.AAC.3